jgi:hypothetical protein
MVNYAWASFIFVWKLLKFSMLFNISFYLIFECVIFRTKSGYIIQIYHCKISTIELTYSTRWSVVFSVYSGFLHHQNWLPRYDCNIVESGVKHHYPLSGMHSFWSLHRRSDVMYREGIFFPLRGEIIGFVCVIICMHSRWSLHKRVLVKPQRSITLDLLMMFRFKARVINNCIPTLYQVICFPVFYNAYKSYDFTA